MSSSKFVQRKGRNVLINTYDKFVSRSIKLLQHDTNSDNSILQFIDFVSQSQSKWGRVIKKCNVRMRNMHNYILRLRKVQSSTQDLLEVESVRRRKAERGRDRFKRKLDIIKEVLQGNDVEGAIRHLENIDRSASADRSMTRLEHSAGSLLDPENVSDENILNDSFKFNSKFKRCKSGSSSASRRSVRLRDKRSSSVPMVNDSNIKPIHDEEKRAKRTLDDAEYDYYSVLPKPTFGAGMYLSTVQSSLNGDTSSIGSSEFVNMHSVVASQTNTNNVTTPLSTTMNRLNRPHNFITRSALRLASCDFCGNRITFGRSALKCICCRLIVHPNCSKQLTQTCIPTSSSRTPLSSVHKQFETLGTSPHPPTSNAKGITSGTKMAYSPTSFIQRAKGWNVDLNELCPEDQVPRIPALVIHCVNEVLARGMQTVGIYRISGSDKRVRELCEKFLQGKNPVLARIEDINVVCGCLKMFLRSLSEPLVTYEQRPVLENAATRSQKGDETAVQQVVDALEALPSSYRDTLSFIMLHLKTVARSASCQMNEGNLSKVFGPTLIGYSCAVPLPMQTLTEIQVQQDIMRLLFKVPDDIYSAMLSTTEDEQNFAPHQDTHFSPLLPIPINSSIATTPLRSRRTKHTGLSSARGRRFLPYFSFNRHQE